MLHPLKILLPFYFPLSLSSLLLFSPESLFSFSLSLSLNFPLSFPLYLLLSLSFPLLFLNLYFSSNLLSPTWYVLLVLSFTFTLLWLLFVFLMQEFLFLFVEPIIIIFLLGCFMSKGFFLFVPAHRLIPMRGHTDPPVTVIFDTRHRVRGLGGEGLFTIESVSSLLCLFLINTILLFLSSWTSCLFLLLFVLVDVGVRWIYLLWLLSWIPVVLSLSTSRRAPWRIVQISHSCALLGHSKGVGSLVLSRLLLVYPEFLPLWALHELFIFL